MSLRSGDVANPQTLDEMCPSILEVRNEVLLSVDTISYNILMALLFLVVWIKLFYVLFKLRQWKSFIIDLNVIKRNTNYIMLNTFLSAIALVGLGLLIFKFRYRQFSHHVYALNSGILFVNVSLFGLLEAFIKPRITPFGLFYNGRFYKWAKIGTIECDKNMIKIHVISDIGEFTAKLKVTEEPLILKQRIVDYLTEQRKSDEAQIV